MYEVVACGIYIGISMVITIINNNFFIKYFGKNMKVYLNGTS